jgi:hypothetical protein
VLLFVLICFDCYRFGLSFVMPCLVQGIHVFAARKALATRKDVDGRDKPGHDDNYCGSAALCLRSDER